MFCSKCGKEIADNSAICNYCGMSIGSNSADAATRQTERYSKEDYLVTCEEYTKEKKEVEAKYKKKNTTLYILAVICFILALIFMFLFFFNPLVYGVLLLIFLFVAIVPFIIVACNLNKKKTELENLADTYYRRYINKYNSNK